MSTRNGNFNKLIVLIVLAVLTIGSFAEEVQSTSISSLSQSSPTKQHLQYHTSSEESNDEFIQSSLLLNQDLDQQHDLTQQGEMDEEYNEHSEHHYLSPENADFWWTCLLALVLTIVGAFCSGMTVGFCNIDSLQLQVMTKGNNEQDKKMAETILDVISDHHLFLTTLLVYNAIALQSLPLVVHKLMPAWAAILFSTLAVLIAAEIIPQAICTGPKKIIIAYHASPILIAMRKALFFLIIPIARGLDWLVGVHDINRIQHKDFANFLTGNKLLKKTQKRLLTSTLELRCSRVQQKMIPLRKLFMLQSSQILDSKKIQQILKNEYSFILVFKDKRQDIVGFIKVKEFSLKYLKNGNKPIKVSEVTQTGRQFLSVYNDTNMLEMLMLFQANSSRIALVCDQKKKTASGIPSIMYTKNDMIMKKKGATIIGAVFLYQIFDQMKEADVKSPRKNKKKNKEGSSTELKEMSIKDPLLKNNH